MKTFEDITESLSEIKIDPNLSIKENADILVSLVDAAIKNISLRNTRDLDMLKFYISDINLCISEYIRDGTRVEKYKKLTTSFMMNDMKICFNHIIHSIKNLGTIGA
jgi:hypothetical protein